MLLDPKEPVGHHTSAHFLHSTGYSDTVIGKEGLACDIIVAEHDLNDNNVLYDKNIVASLFNTGRPVLLLPPATGPMPQEWMDDVISIAWDGSMEAARAIFNSMPLLERAENIYLLTAARNRKSGHIELQHSMMEYLHAHGLTPHHIIVDCDDTSPAAIILDKANALKSNLLVMGAYGHSRFREIIMGGFTKYMLENANIPLLLSH